MIVSKNIFRNYDIRGIYPDELNENVAYNLGRAIGTINVKKNLNKIVVGRDDRASSPALSKSLIDGIVSTGCHVCDVGITITPVIHFLSRTEDFDMGIIVTASHNPKQYNGFRIDYRNAYPFYGDSVLMLRFMVEREEYISGSGSYEYKNYNEKYIEFLKKNFKFNNRLKVVIDCGSGATSEIAPKVFNELGCDVVPVFCSYDSNFPHGTPDPENSLFMDELKDCVVQHKANVGFAYDTDGDRMGFVDELGNAYTADRILMLLADSVLERSKGAKIAYDVKSSSLVEDVIRQNGGIPLPLRTGHPYFQKIVMSEALLGAEFAGHIYFSDDYFGYDDGIYASCRILKILDQKNKSLSDLMSKYPNRVSTNELKVSCPDILKFKVINILKIYIMNFVEYKKIIDIDGVRVQITDTGWFLIRASNTGSYLSIRAEGEDSKELDHLLEIIRSALSSIDIVKLNIDF